MASQLHFYEHIAKLFCLPRVRRVVACLLQKEGLCQTSKTLVQASAMVMLQEAAYSCCIECHSMYAYYKIWGQEEVAEEGFRFQLP